MECAARGRGGPCVFGPPTRRCGLCGAVAYCSPSHQMLHWNEHKDECARLEQQMRHADFLNDFPFTFSMEATRSFHKMLKFYNIAAADAQEPGLWNYDSNFTKKQYVGSRFHSLNAMWTHGMGDLSPGLCYIKENWIEKSLVEDIIRTTHVVLFSYSKILDDWKLPSSLCPCTEPKSPLSTCLRSWKDYYEWRCLPFHSPVALLLHWPLTIYHCYQLLAVRSLISEVGNRLCIHYLGPDKELWQLAVFGELRALFPAVQLQIELVGPAVPQFMDGMMLELCEYCKCSEESCPCKSSCMDSDTGGSNGQTSKVVLKLHKGFYHDRYMDIIKDSYPQLIVAPNAGVAAYSNWLPTIKLIKEMGVPAVFSDFCEEAAYLGARCISTMTSQPLKPPIQINPFRQPMEVEDSALYLPCYSNCFLFGI